MKKLFSKLLVILLLYIIIGNNSFADKLADIKESGILKAGVRYDFKLFSFINKSYESKKIVGFDIDLLRYIANEWDVELSLQQVSSKNSISMLQTNKIDLLTSLTINQIKKDSGIGYTQPYFFDGFAVLVNKNSKKKNLTSFNGSKVAVFKNFESGKKLRQYSNLAIIIKYKDYLKAIDNLKKGSIDAIIANLTWCSDQVKNSNGKLKIINNLISQKPHSIGMIKDELNFKDAVNFTIQKSIIDGTYIKLYKKWFNKNLKILPKMWPVNDEDIKPVK